LNFDKSQTIEKDTNKSNEVITGRLKMGGARQISFSMQDGKTAKVQLTEPNVRPLRYGIGPLQVQ